MSDCRSRSIADIDISNVSILKYVNPCPLYTCNSMLQSGWMHGRNGELLFWIPPSHRTALWRPSNTLVIGENSTKLNLYDFVHGTAWSQCHVLNHYIVLFLI